MSKNNFYIVSNVHHITKPATMAKHIAHPLVVRKVYRIPIQPDDALDSVDDHLKLKE